MTKSNSVDSENRDTRWLYTKPAFGRTGRSLSENNFAKERRSWLAILLREILQNGLDARSDALPVTVSLSQRKLVGKSLEFMQSLLPTEHVKRFDASTPHIQVADHDLSHVLVVEDFGTSGLIGAVDDPDLDGKGQNWNAFWFREGEGGKEQGVGNGGAGQGKITYFSTSAIRTLFAYTVRNSDGVGVVYGASSFLRDYQFGGVKWLRDSYWGIRKSHAEATIAIPSTDAEFTRQFVSQLGLERSVGETGLSLVIPAPRVFDSDEAIQVVIAEFYAPIIRGDLIVRIDGALVSSETVDAMAAAKLSDQKARELHTCTTKGYRAFFAQAIAKSKRDEVVQTTAALDAGALSEKSFDPVQLASLRELLVAGEPIAVRFPLTIKPRAGPAVACSFDVHLMIPEDLDIAEEAVLRKDLLIGEEPIGGGGLRQRARGLTLINHQEVSKLLLSAEEPTHLRWNARLPRLREYYKSGPETVSLIRNAMSKLLEFLTGGDESRDFRLLAKYFAAPGTAVHKTSKGKKGGKGREPQPVVNVIPPPSPKKINLQALVDGCSLSPVASQVFCDSDLPVTGELEFAYEGLDKDAFGEYDPFDFDLSDSHFNIATANCSISSRALNRLVFTIESSIFSLTVSGFDKNLRLRMRLDYQENRHAEDIDA